MSRRNGFQGPGTWNADLGVYKNFKLTERFGMQFRSEFFNIANHPRTLIVGNGTNDVSFAVLPTTTASGQPVANAGAPYVQAFKAGRRQIQFALKLSF
jgi:hypothetical protein